MNHLHLLLLFLLALPESLLGQDLGRGNLGVGGLEPRLSLQSASPGKTMHIRVTDLAPPGASGAQLLVLLAAAPAEIPLDGLGVKGGVLGLDLAAMLLLGPVPVDATGKADLGMRVDAAWSGAHVWVQALYVDPRVTPPYVFSDSRSMTLGSPDPEVVLGAEGSVTGRIDLVRRLPDGRAGTPLPWLGGLVLQDLDLAALDEERRFRADLPGSTTIGSRRAVRLADGSTLLLADHPAAARSMLLRAHRSGRVEIVHRESRGNLAAVLAASTTHVAFTTLVPPRLFLLRLDGSNWPGTAEPLRDVTPATGLRLEPTALTFGTRVLAHTDRARGLFLIPLAGGQTIVPKLPNSGGRPPVAFDEEIAVSGDGRSFAFGAGPGRKAKDIYVVRDDGRAVNVTKRVSDYAEVGHTNPGRRIELALSHDGGLVSYVDEGGQEPENYVTKVVLPQPVHITSSRAFVDSIDIGTTTRLLAKGGGLIVAGLDAASLDLFFTPSISDKDIVPLTKTAPTNTPPFGKDAKLSVLDLGSVAGSHQYLLHARHKARTAPELWVVDTVQRTARIASGSFTGLGAPLPGGPRLLVEDASAVVLVDPRDSTAGFARRIALGSGRVRSLSVDPAIARAAVVAGPTGAHDLWLVDPATLKATRLTASASDLGEARAGHLPGEILALSAPQTNGRALLRWRSGSGLANVGGKGLLFFAQR